MRKLKKNIISVVMILILTMTVFAGCTNNDNKTNTPTPNTPQETKPTDDKQPNNSSFDTNKEITVVARDSASGTRTAFHELMKVIVKDGDNQTDNLVTGALEFDGTDKVITAVEGDQFAIGYISMGSVSDRIKAINVDGVEPTVENVKNKTYAVSRPFLLVTNGEENEIVKDFMSFILSKQGQEIVNSKKFIKAEDNAKEYTASGKSGTIKIAGSTSIAPLMEAFTEEYNKLNPDVKFEMQSNGSSQGIKAATDKTYDIGMSSRELKDDEKKALNEHIVALDGIAVILNKDNPINDMKSEKITGIYTGTIAKWNEVE